MTELFAALADVVDALTNPSQHRTPRHTWSQDRRNRNKIRLPDHVVVLPGALTQLAALAFPLGAAGDDSAGVRALPQSRPPGHPQALAAYLDIHRSVSRWSHEYGLRPRRTIDATLRGLLGAAPSQPGQLRDLLSDATRWLAWCEEITGWRTAGPILTVPCPGDTDPCGYRTLRVDIDHKTVQCMSCGARWAEQETDTTGSLDALGQYVTGYRQAAGVAAETVWANARARQAAVDGKSPPTGLTSA